MPGRGREPPQRREDRPCPTICPLVESSRRPLPMFRKSTIVLAMSGVFLLAALGGFRAASGGDVKSEADPIALFDGKSLKGWTDASGKAPAEGWEVVDGAFHRKGKAGYLVSDRQFDNFDLRFDWKIVKGANSGVKYRTTRVEKKGLYGCEYQLLDNENHPNGKKATTRCGALYDLYAPEEGPDLVKPVGEYNTSRVVAQ